MHECSKTAAAPTSHLAMRKRCCCSLVNAAYFFLFFVSRLAPTCAELGRFALTRHKSIRIKQNHRNTPIQAIPADSGRNSKKKKKKKRVQNASFELNNKTLNYLRSQNAPFFTSIFSSLSLYVLHLPS